MAAKKTETKATTTEVKAETKAKKVEKKDDDLVPIHIPIDYSNPDDTSFYCAVNGTAMLIPKGETVEVPRRYAEAYKLVEAEQKIKLERAREAKAAEIEGNRNYINSTT